jgi:GTP:adenosylcobinamide-phosphate guanylyltransferase
MFPTPRGGKTRRINKNEKRVFVNCGEALVFLLCWLAVIIVASVSSAKAASRMNMSLDDE